MVSRSYSIVIICYLASEFCLAFIVRFLEMIKSWATIRTQADEALSCSRFAKFHVSISNPVSSISTFLHAVSVDYPGRLIACLKHTHIRRYIYIYIDEDK